MLRRRVKLTLSEEAYGAIRRIANVSDCGLATVVSGFIEPNVAALLNVADKLEEALRLRESMPSVVGSSVADVGERMAEGVASGKPSEPDVSASDEVGTAGHLDSEPVSLAKSDAMCDLVTEYTGDEMSLDYEPEEIDPDFCPGVSFSSGLLDECGTIGDEI